MHPGSTAHAFTAYLLHSFWLQMSEAELDEALTSLVLGPTSSAAARSTSKLPGADRDASMKHMSPGPDGWVRGGDVPWQYCFVHRTVFAPWGRSGVGQM